MKIKSNSTNFEPCPEFTGQAVCVDVTPLRKQQSQFGERNVFKIVFESNLEKEDGTRYCVWSNNFTPTLNEKSSLRKFLRGWFGRDLTKAELENFDTESLINRPAQLVVVHEHKDGEVYANIAACTPDRSNEPLAASGKFVRYQDRQAVPGAQSSGAEPSSAASGNGSRGGYRPAQRQEAPQGVDLGATKIHVGRCKGLEVRDLSPEQVQALIGHWLPTAKANAKPSADDRRLIAALEWWEAQNAVPAGEEPF